MATLYESQHAIRQFAIVASGWTDIVGLAALPINCNQVIIFNNSAVPIYLCTNPNIPTSQVTIQPGQAYDIGTARGGGALGTYLFQAGSGNPVCSLMSSAGSVNVIIESIA